MQLRLSRPAARLWLAVWLQLACGCGGRREHTEAPLFADQTQQWQVIHCEGIGSNFGLQPVEKRCNNADSLGEIRTLDAPEPAVQKLI